MALQTFLTSVASATTIANLGTVDDCVVGAQATLLSGTNAIVGTGTTQNVTVFGTVYGVSSGISLSGAASTFDTITIALGGSVTGDNAAIAIDSDGARVSNHGTLSSDNWGIYMTSNGASSCSVFNSGTIYGWSAVGAIGSSRFTLNNTGRIEALNQAFTGNDLGQATVKNYGTMIGDISFGDLDDTLINRGFIDGTIRMGDGDDRVTVRGEVGDIIILGLGNDDYDGSRAPLSDIRVIGDEGDDSFTMGQASENIEGDEGIDSVNYYRATSGVTVYLDGQTPNDGAATGDTFYQVEYLYGTNYIDRLYGTDDANFLYGNHGADVLSGGAGDDTMGGAQGVDKLTGGDGNDTFNFYGLANEKVDEIADFSNDVGNNDILAVFTGGIFVGLAPGSLVQSQFRSRNDNLAQDADDRFIFNKTDNSLWFDSNGNADGGLTQILVLLNETNLTFADILIF